MKRFVFSLLLGLFIMPFSMAQESEPLPDAEVLKAANDSILAEAYLLYLFEKSAWVLEDVLAASMPATMNEMGGWFPLGDEENEDVAGEENGGEFVSTEVTPEAKRTKDGDGSGSYQGAFEFLADVQLKKK